MGRVHIWAKTGSAPGWVVTSLQCPMSAFVGHVPLSRVPQQGSKGVLAPPLQLLCFVRTGAWTHNPPRLTSLPNRPSYLCPFGQLTLTFRPRCQAEDTWVIAGGHQDKGEAMKAESWRLHVFLPSLCHSQGWKQSPQKRGLDYVAVVKRRITVNMPSPLAIVARVLVEFAVNLPLV